MAGRRTDTRERIQQVALELFAERGYDKTTLQEVAERLDITRPALYYHFRTKEAILASVVDRLTESMDELVAWAKEQPATAGARLEILRRIAGLLEDQWRPLFRFAQVNQGALRESAAGERLQTGVISMLSLLSSPQDGPVRQFEARLAVFAVILGNVPFLSDMGLEESERTAVALEVAAKLIADD
ncbi:TetR family transcriptional regulator [Nonomuraea fuscirosea]|uniref:TetR family transcriptional regulator n=1 Tax=Nonomuraea fuscirosea TaxID=1291556 RepID=A0A2T0NBL7_9ACTN|nr:TetR/AcrR family transcriptional regulator [Nonomuraea fuscirosea]PRX70412.1 TetR family transcriptional regulator [Nonomuraea fuscirosea]